MISANPCKYECQQNLTSCFDSFHHLFDAFLFFRCDVRLQSASEKIEAWRKDYNHERLHSALGNLALREFASSDQACMAR